MPGFTQSERPLRISTPLGEDVLLVTRLRGEESLSQLFRFELELVAEIEHEVKFEAILGQSVTVKHRLTEGETRYFNGIVRCFTHSGRDRSGETVFNCYRAEIVPNLWLPTKKIDSRVFQHQTVPDILRKVLHGIDVSFDLSGHYPAREYCVQYSESDFAFASRLMEDEGIQYFFKHEDGKHQMVLSDRKNPTVIWQNSIVFERAEGGSCEDPRVTTWEKTQELRAGSYVAWDHSFELPHNNLDAKQKSIENVIVGKITHKLRVAANEPLEIYEYPGGWAQRFDGVSPGGAPQPQELQQVFDERERVARIRIEQEETPSLRIKGESFCGQFSAGHKFTLTEHGEGDGEYLLTHVEHEAKQSGFVTGDQLTFDYRNNFLCAPSSLPWRPQRVTAKPVIAGVQTATVSGTPGEEIFCDQYGRVKVQFHWDREGKMDGATSCWVRVAQVWAGKGWGAFFWPRVGHEVVVTFEEGDPDKPLIVGSVYNEENKPWFALPVNKQLAGFKSASMRGDFHKNFNGIVFNDRKGQEHLAIHSERNLSLNCESDKMIHAGRHKGERVAVANVLTVGKLVPGGGSGGGDFAEGDPIGAPAPSGVVGMNSIFTFGDNLQATLPLNHQMTFGNNVQICVNPVGLTCGVPNMPGAQTMQAVLGSGMGGSMQFTIGTSAQFTLGQSFEISIGPPKIEIHDDYKNYPTVKLFCGMLGAAVLIFSIAYDIATHSDAHGYQSPSDQQKDAVQESEQPGDQGRAVLALMYQVLSDIMLTAILQNTSIANQLEWLADDKMKEFWATDQQILEAWKAPNIPPDADEPTNWWENWGALAFGCAGAIALITGEVVVVGEENT